jgi:ribonuclease E
MRGARSCLCSNGMRQCLLAMLARGRAPRATAPSAELDDAVGEPKAPRPAPPPAAAGRSAAWRSSFRAGVLAAAAAWAHAAELGFAGPAGAAAVARALARLRSAPPPAAASAGPPGAPARRASPCSDPARTPTLPLPSHDALSHSAARAAGRAAAPACPSRSTLMDSLTRRAAASSSGAAGTLPARGGGAARGCGAGWGDAAGAAERAAPGAARARASSARQAASSARHPASSSVTCRRRESSGTRDASVVRAAHRRAACSRSVLHAVVFRPVEHWWLRMDVRTQPWVLVRTHAARAPGAAYDDAVRSFTGWR